MMHMEWSCHHIAHDITSVRHIQSGWRVCDLLCGRNGTDVDLETLSPEHSQNSSSKGHHQLPKHTSSNITGTITDHGAGETPSTPEGRRPTPRPRGGAGPPTGVGGAYDPDRPLEDPHGGHTASTEDYGTRSPSEDDLLIKGPHVGGRDPGSEELRGGRGRFQQPTEPKL